jgi:hypothetical protein
MDINISVLVHGHVLVGIVEDMDEHFICLKRAATLRRWGTSKGLGELARGPMPNTVTDPIPSSVRIPIASVIYTFRVEGWEPTFAAMGER